MKQISDKEVKEAKTLMANLGWRESGQLVCSLIARIESDGVLIAKMAKVIMLAQERPVQRDLLEVAERRVYSLLNDRGTTLAALAKGGGA